VRLYNRVAAALIEFEVCSVRCVMFCDRVHARDQTSYCPSVLNLSPASPEAEQYDRLEMPTREAVKPEIDYFYSDLAFRAQALWHGAWVKGVDAAAKGLQRPLLVRHPESGAYAPA